MHQAAAHLVGTAQVSAAGQVQLTAQATLTKATPKRGKVLMMGVAVVRQG